MCEPAIGRILLIQAGLEFTILTLQHWRSKEPKEAQPNGPPTILLSVTCFHLNKMPFVQQHTLLLR